MIKLNEMERQNDQVGQRGGGCSLYEYKGGGRDDEMMGEGVDL